MRRKIKKLIPYFLNFKEMINGSLYIDYSKINQVDILKLLEDFVANGYLLHGSEKRVVALAPFQGISRSIAYGNLKGVYSTRAPNAKIGSKITKNIIEKHWKNCRADKIPFAIEQHADGYTQKDKLIASIWDGDRLDSYRLGSKIDLNLFLQKQAN